MLFAFLWGLGGGIAADAMRAPGPWKVRLPLFGMLPTVIIGPGQGQGLLDRLQAIVPVGQLGST